MAGMDELAAKDLGTALADVLRRVEGGHSFRITLDGRPVAWLLPPHGRPPAAPMEWVLEQLNRACADHELVIDLRETIDYPCEFGWP